MLIKEYKGSVSDCVERIIQENYMLYYYRSSLSNEYVATRYSSTLNAPKSERYYLAEILENNTFKAVSDDDVPQPFEVASRDLLLASLHQFSDNTEFRPYDTFEPQSWFYWDKLPEDEWFEVHRLYSNERVFALRIDTLIIKGIEEKYSSSYGMYELAFKGVMIKKSDADSILDYKNKTSNTKPMSESEKDKLYILISGLCSALGEENPTKYITGSKVNATEVYRKLEKILGGNLPYKTEKKLQSILSDVKQLINQ